MAFWVNVVFVAASRETSFPDKKRESPVRLSLFVHAVKRLLLLWSNNRLLGRLSRSSSGSWICLPVVQVVCNAVAVCTFREPGHDACCVRHAVAILALRNHLVLLLVTGYAEKCLVLCLACYKEAESF